VKRWGRWALRALGPVLFGVLLWYADTDALAALLANAAPLPLLAAALINVPILFMRAERWHQLLTPDAPTRRETVPVYALGVFAGTFTPGQLGELAKIFFLESKGLTTAKSTWATIADRLLDLIVLSAHGLLFLWVFSSWPVWTIPASFAVASAAIYAMMRIDSEKLPGPIRRLLLKVMLHRPPARVFLPSILYTAAAWYLNWTAIWIGASAIGLEIPFLYLSGAMAACALLSILPISVMGIGTRDAALIFFTAPLGWASGDALALSMIVLFLRLAYSLPCALAMMSAPGRAARRSVEKEAQP